ncbi:MAG: tetraacyldisaccharide 4'-kinase [Bacteroidales bacterium]|nr:tetraacyldisaccharide 4'-kinase [Bacteroidales bacterium]
MDTKGFILLPISILYGIITFLRNVLFNIGIFQSKKHPIVVISIGNLSMGGTGKTPHVEYLIRQLQENFKIATLSRGYGRKTKGFLLANEESNSNTIGDEPMQYFNKFKDLLVAVDEKRNNGISKLLENSKDLKIIILDDAFQHRWVKPDLSILLTDFHNLYHQDYMFPSGQLREFRRGAKRADIIVVTKTNVVLSPITRRRVIDDLRIKPYQKLLFSKIIYDGFVKWENHEAMSKPPQVSTIVLFSGIANSYPLRDFLKKHCNELVVLSFSDHHDYSEKDIQLILKTYDDQFTSNKVLITTEKDIQRLEVNPQKHLFQEIPLYYIPIHISFHNHDERDLESSVSNLFR